MVDEITSNPNRSKPIVNKDGTPTKQLIDWNDDLELIINELVKFRGALVYKSNDQTIPNNTDTTLSWDVEKYDTDNIHDNSVNNSRLTVPAGVSVVILSSSVVWQNNTTGVRLKHINKNGIGFVGSGSNEKSAENSIVVNMGSLSAPVMVVPGDYFELEVFQTSGGNLDIFNTNGIETWFSMQILQ